MFVCLSVFVWSLQAGYFVSSVILAHNHLLDYCFISGWVSPWTRVRVTHYKSFNYVRVLFYFVWFSFFFFWGGGGKVHLILWHQFFLHKCETKVAFFFSAADRLKMFNFDVSTETYVPYTLSSSLLQ